MLKITVKDSKVVEDVMRTTGDVIRQQWATFENADGIEMPFKVGLGKREPYQPGEYTISPEGFGTTRYNKLELRFVALVPVSPQAVRKTVGG